MGPKHCTWCRSPKSALWLPSTSCGLTGLDLPGSTVEQLAPGRRDPVHRVVEEEAEEVWRHWQQDDFGLRDLQKKLNALPRERSSAKWFALVSMYVG